LAGKQLPQDFAKFFCDGVTSPFAARAMPTRSSDKRQKKYANLAAAAALLEFELCSYVAFGLLKGPAFARAAAREATDN
jgi:hypothetical protein